MYFTALLMARFPDWNNLIYGVSWWLALLGTAHSVAQAGTRGRAVTGISREDASVDSTGRRRRRVGRLPVGNGHLAA